MAIIFISAIDTGIGKSYTTGLLGAYLKQQGHRVSTAKLIQTGSSHPAEDILIHRQLMHDPVTPADLQGLTCPYVFSYAASPHLAAHLAHQVIDVDHLIAAIRQLDQQHDYLLVEGAGGLRVPLTSEITILDLIKQQHWPVLLASSARLGSINHTWLSVETLEIHQINLLGITYTVPPKSDPVIAQDSLSFFQKKWPNYPVLSIPWVHNNESIDLSNFSMIKFNAPV